MNTGLKLVSVTALPSVPEPGILYDVAGAVTLIDPLGNAQILYWKGQTTLVAGTKAITLTGMGTGSRAFVQLVTPNSAALTVDIQAVCTANTLTLTALIAAKTINAVDVSVVNYLVYP